MRQNSIVENVQYTLFVYLIRNFTGQNRRSVQSIINLITAILGHFKRIIAPYFTCEIEDERMEFNPTWTEI